jgi:predicted aspartyl protease
MTFARTAPIFCAAFCALFSIATAFTTGARATECAPAQLTTVSTDALPDGRIRVPVMLGGRALSLLVDTGGASSTIKGELAREMGLAVKQAQHRIAGVGGSQMNFAVDSENLSIAELRVDNKPIYVESRPLPSADGTLAADILRNYDVEFDMARSRMSLAAPSACAAPVWALGPALPIEVGQSGHVRFPVKVDGKIIMATLDTGAATSVISMRAAAALGVTRNSPGLELVHDTGNYRLYTYPFHALELGGVTVSKPSIAIASDNFLPGADTELVLGIDALSQMRFTIAYGQNRLYISGAQIN